MDADFSTQYTILSNVQLERALTNDFSVSVGYVNSLGRNMPVLVDTNLVPTGQTLADGRPIFSTAVTSATRVDPTFNHVDTFQSVGRGTYNALTVTMNKRMSHGFQAQASLHPGQGRGQRAPHRHLRRGQPATTGSPIRRTSTATMA